jgi:raffinose/stachyose/melibiose transport system permease protein
MQMQSASGSSSTETVAVSPSAAGYRRKAQLQRTTTIVAFLIPATIVYVVFVILPVIQAAYYSLFRWNGLGPLTNFVGLENFSKLLREPVFIRALGHNLLIVALSVAIQLPLALALALLVAKRFRGRTVFRMIFFLPFVLSEVVTGVIWSFIYHPQSGLLNVVLQSLIPGFKYIPWLGIPSTVMFAVFVVLTWKYFGFYFILFTAGLQNIPAELDEAARIDGATGSQVIRYITLPLLSPTIRLCIYLAVLGSLQVFDLVWIMTTGGPVNASETMATYLYKFGFQRFQLGYGSAVAVVMFILCFGFSLLYQRFVMRRDIAM